MATSKVRTLLSLDRFFEIVGANPLHANQVVLPDLQPQTCGQPIFQYSWQHSDAMSREEISHAIASAEARIAEYLGYKLLPTWESDDRIYFKKGKIYADVHANGPAYQADYGHVITGGIEQKLLIQATRPVVYTDLDSDGYAETATITVATNVTLPEEIAIYYPGESGSDDWEIRPTQVVLAGGTATITCKRHQLVKKDLLEALTVDEVDGSDVNNFLASVDVYRHYNDPQQQIQFIWENGCSCATGSGCYAATYTVQQGALFVRDYERGLVVGVPATWNTAEQAFDIAGWSACRPPDKARLWYRAGLRYKGSYLRMHPEWERVVANFAMALMDRPLCSCVSLEAVSMRAKLDYAEVPISGTRYQVRSSLLDNPFGTTVGAVEAWRKVRTNMLGQAVDLHV